MTPQEHKTELSEALKNHKQEIQRVRQEELQQSKPRAHIFSLVIWKARNLLGSINILT